MCDRRPLEGAGRTAIPLLPGEPAPSSSRIAGSATVTTVPPRRTTDEARTALTAMRR